MKNENSNMALSALDLQKWMSALTLQPRISGSLMDWVVGPLRDFFPFERVFIGHGEQIAGQIRVTHWLAHGHDELYLSQMASTFDVTTRGALSRWLLQREPFFIDISQPPSFATLFELKEIEEFNLGRLAGHGVLNATSSAGTYFSFAGIPTQFTSWHLDALRLIAPVLNDLFLNYIAYGKKESAVFLSKLTCRQTEIVRLTARGKNGKSIALELCISEKTVRNQLTSIYAELGVRSRFELMNLLR